ncbi:hypothetical protein BHM03_00039954 [Ensete ventricosum]|nr:hypothetical protein BHM03_00039954 [Ensete ventricosum]
MGKADTEARDAGVVSESGRRARDGTVGASLIATWESTASLRFMRRPLMHCVPLDVMESSLESYGPHQTHVFTKAGINDSGPP